jgi:hypothetical protein
MLQLSSTADELVKKIKMEPGFKKPQNLSIKLIISKRTFKYSGYFGQQ